MRARCDVLPTLLSGEWESLWSENNWDSSGIILFYYCSNIVTSGLVIDLETLTKCDKGVL